MEKKGGEKEGEGDCALKKCFHWLSIKLDLESLSRSSGNPRTQMSPPLLIGLMQKLKRRRRSGTAEVDITEMEI